MMIPLGVVALAGCGRKPSELDRPLGGKEPENGSAASNVARPPTEGSESQ
jgi:hypothetical protein